MRIIGVIGVPLVLVGAMMTMMGEASIAVAGAVGVFSFAGWVLGKARG
jgi:hypothetical protein